MFGYIYLTENLVNFKCYIGKREKPFFDIKYLGSGKHLKSAINYYGKDNFVCQPIQWCETREDLLAAEKFWIEKCQANTSDLFYNITQGGIGGSSLGRKATDETKEKLVKAWEKRKIIYKGSDLLARKNAGKTNSDRHCKTGFSNKELEGYKKMAEKHKKPVICIETNQIFESIKSAVDYWFSINKLKNGKGIYQALKCNKIWNGYHWKYL